MSNTYEAPDGYGLALEHQLKTASAHPTDRASIAALKTASANDQLTAFAEIYREAHAADLTRGAGRRAIIDAAKLKAARELGVPISEVRVMEVDDEAAPIPPPPDPYAPHITALRAHDAAVAAVKGAGR